jgi:hypothetical protein
MMTPQLRSNGLLHLTLSADGNQIKPVVSRLVAMAFIGPPLTPKHRVNFIDDDPTNIRPENLKWVTRSEDTQRVFRLGRRVGKGGEKNPNSLLTQEQVREIRAETYRVGLYRRLSEKYGVSSDAARKAYLGLTYRE